MKKISLSSLLTFAVALTTLSACGGGGGGGGASGVSIPSQPTKAVLTLSTAVTNTIPGTTTINSYDVTVTLPAGVTVKASPDSINPALLIADPGVVTPTGSASGSSLSAIYAAATDIMPGTVKIHLASGTGFSPGDFCTIACDISSGTHPRASDFAAPILDDATGLDASVSTVMLTGDLSVTVTAVIN